jgi:hypothetical protein
MSIQNKLYFVLKLIVIASFFLPMVTTRAAGSLRLVNTNEIKSGASISFYSGKTDSNGYVIFPDKICVNGLIIDFKDYNYINHPVLPQIENTISGTLVNPTPGTYKLKYPEDDNTSKSEEFILTVKPYHSYEFELVDNNLVLRTDG